jgi:hypothetical protein
MRKIMEKMSKWTTTKKTLYFAMAAMVCYTGFHLLLNSLGASIDTELTDQVFSFLKWIVVTGGAISGVKLVTSE